MLTTEIQEMEQRLSFPVNLSLTVNDLRILVTSLNGMEYFGKEHGESYLDPEANDLKDRLEQTYYHLSL